MNKLFFTLAVALLGALPMIAANDLAIVENVKGVLVFTDCTPTADYDVIGEVTYVDEAYEPGNGIPPRYQDIKMGLIINAVLAHRDAEAIITTINDNGTGSADIIKFKPNTINRDQARVNSYKGLLYFANCKPLAPYQTIKRLQGSPTFRYGLVRKHFIKKASKRSMRNKGVNGVIVEYNKKVRDVGELIRL